MQSFASENEAKDYIHFIESEMNSIAEINLFLQNNFDPQQPDIEKIKNYIKKKWLDVNAAHKAQIDFLRKEITIAELPYDLKQKIANILAIKYTDPEKMTHKLELIMKYLCRVEIYSNKEADINAYFDYVNSLLTRFILIEDTKFITKIESLLNKNNIIIKIINSEDGDYIEAYPEKNKMYEFKLKAIDQDLLSYLYALDPKKFETYVNQKGGYYRSGTPNIKSEQLQYLTIGVQDKSYLCAVLVGEFNGKIIHYVPPQFLLSAHEEAHGLRMLRGASRTAKKILPKLIDASYNSNMEEFFNIKIGKTSERSLSQLYQLPQKRIGHAGHIIITQPEKMNPDFELTEDSKALWQFNYYMAQIETNLIAISHLNIKDYDLFYSKDYAKLKMLIENHTEPKTELSPLIAAFFYQEIRDLKYLEPLFLAYANHSETIPSLKTPLHLLALFDKNPNINADEYDKYCELIINLCIKYHINMNQYDEHGQAALMYAIKNNNLALVKKILTCNQTIFPAEKDNDNNIVILAIKSNNIELFQNIISYVRDKHPEFLKNMLMQEHSLLALATHYGNADIFLNTLEVYSMVELDSIKNPSLPVYYFPNAIMKKFIATGDSLYLLSVRDKLGVDSFNKLFINVEILNYVLSNDITNKQIKLLNKVIRLNELLSSAEGLYILINNSNKNVLQKLLPNIMISSNNINYIDHKANNILHASIGGNNIFDLFYSQLKNSLIPKGQIKELLIAKNNEGMTPLHIMLSTHKDNFMGYNTAIKLLKLAGPTSFNILDNKGNSLFFYALKYPDVAFAMIEIATQANPLLIDQMFNTALTRINDLEIEHKKLLFKCINKYNSKAQPPFVVENKYLLKLPQNELAELSFDGIILSNLKELSEKNLHIMKTNLIGKYQNKLKKIDSIVELTELFSQLIINQSLLNIEVPLFNKVVYFFDKVKPPTPEDLFKELKNKANLFLKSKLLSNEEREQLEKIRNFNIKTMPTLKSNR